MISEKILIKVKLYKYKPALRCDELFHEYLANIGE